MTKIISWNLNGIKSCLRKGLNDFIHDQNADIYCFQEIKVSPQDVRNISFDGYNSYWFPAEKNGYSGVLTCLKKEPLSVIKGINTPIIDKEGRILTIEHDKFFLLNAYFPHAHRELIRHPFKLMFNNSFSSFCENLSRKKPLVIMGDLNVAHKEIDLRNPRENEGNAGFTKEERKWFDSFLSQGYIDTLREFTKDGGHYTWWTYRNNARKRNIGWRIDYALVSNALKDNVKQSAILSDVYGSDHCPILLEIGI